MSKVIDLSGQRFGRWTVTALAGVTPKGSAKWECVCDCGKSGVVLAGILKRGDSRSCGCLQRTLASQRFKTHGDTGSKEYRIWSAMIQRCTNPKVNTYKYYGARGIKVCDRWMTFENFLDDMGRKPDGRSIDRKDNDGDYEPGNCRWATSLEQSLNQRRPILPPSARRRAATCKLDVVQVSVIKARLASGEHYAALAPEYGVKPITVWSINAGKTWRDVAPADLSLPGSAA